MTAKPFFSIIIPIRQPNSLLRQTQRYLRRQTLQDFELIIVSDKECGNVSPAVKRNFGANKAAGQYLVFLDDDSYPAHNYLQVAKKLVTLHPSYAAFCGPCLTPPANNWRQQATGIILSSWLGSGGAGTYRNRPQKPRFVNDYPSVNLIVKASVFHQVRGFDTHHWPGEDTLLCLAIIQQKLLIYYHPKLVVYHHRRQIIWPLVQQHMRYGQHRGFFAKRYPQNSFQLGYLIPSFLTIYLFLSPILFILHPLTLLPLLAYLALLTGFFIRLLFSHPLKFALATTLTIGLIHISYGINFIIGYFSSGLQFIPHQIDQQGNYLGG